MEEVSVYCAPAGLTRHPVFLVRDPAGVGRRPVDAVYDLEMRREY